MSPSDTPYSQPPRKPSHSVKEETIEYGFIGKLQDFKYEYRADIRNRAQFDKRFLASARGRRRSISAYKFN